MIINNKSIRELHFDHELWLIEMAFWKQEIEVLDKYLAAVNASYSDTVVRAEVEHFQNQFIIQLNFINSLKNDVKAQEALISLLEKDISNKKLQQKKADDEYDIRDRMLTNQKLYVELKQSFKKWLSNKL
jgi:subtilase family serine protease